MEPTDLLLSNSASMARVDSRREATAALPVPMPIGRWVVAVVTVALLFREPLRLWSLDAVGIVLPCLAIVGGGLLVMARLRLSLVLLLYFLLVSLYAVIGLMQSQPPIISAIGWFVLIGFPVFWTIIYNLFPSVSVRWFLRLNVLVSTVVAALAIYQYFSNPTLWGMILSLYDGSDPTITKRAISLVSSPQALAIYLALSVSGLLVLPKTALSYGLIALHVFAMLLTGSKAIAAYFAAFLPMYAYVHRVRPVVIGIFAVVLVLFYLMANDNVLVARVFQPVLGQFSASESVRVGIWWNILAGADRPAALLLGHGLGSAERLTYNLFQYGVDSAESYLLKVLYEMGVAGIALFSMVYGLSWIRMSRLDPPLTPIFAGFLTNLAIVHAFSGLFVAFVFSAMLVAPHAGGCRPRSPS